MPEKKLKVFISYSHEDEDMKNQMDKHLIMLKRSDKIDVWQDRQLIAGQEWDDSIKSELDAADVILLLISVDFNNSKYIWEKELATAMQRHAAGTAVVIPVILRKCEWNEMPYAKLQALPTNAQPVSSFSDKDAAYTDIAVGIRKAVDNMLSRKLD